VSQTQELDGLYHLAKGKIQENHASVDIHGLLHQLGATVAPSPAATLDRCHPQTDASVRD